MLALAERILEKNYEIVPTCVGHGELRIPSEFYKSKHAEFFGLGSSVCVFGEARNVAQGSLIESRWYAENAEGHAPGEIIGSSKIVIEKNGSYDISFQVRPPLGGWSPGAYRVAVYFDSALQADQVFLMR